MKPTYQITYYLKILLTLIIYVTFYIYVVYSFIHAQSIGVKLLYILVGIALGGICSLFELLRIWYDSATKKLIFEGKPEEAVKLLDRIGRFDVFKAFTTSEQMMRMLAMIDMRQFKELLSYVKALETDNYDVQLVRKYTEMVAQGELGNKGKSNEAFKQLVQVRDLKNNRGKKHKGASYLNWEVVNGQHKNYDRDYSAAYKYLKDIDESGMNNRELMHYLAARTIAARNTAHVEDYDASKTRMIKASRNNQYMKDYGESL